MSTGGADDVDALVRIGGHVGNGNGAAGPPTTSMFPFRRRSSSGRHQLIVHPAGGFNLRKNNPVRGGGGGGSTAGPMSLSGGRVATPATATVGGHRTTAMLLVVSFSYVGCLLPLVLLSVVMHVAVLTDRQLAQQLYVALDDCHRVFEFISELNYAANFYIYVMSAAEFRRALRRVVCRSSSSSSSRRRQRLSSSSSSRCLTTLLRCCFRCCRAGDDDETTTRPCGRGQQQFRHGQHKAAAAAPRVFADECVRHAGRVERRSDGADRAAAGGGGGGGSGERVVQLQMKPHHSSSSRGSQNTAAGVGQVAGGAPGVYRFRQFDTRHPNNSAGSTGSRSGPAAEVGGSNASHRHA